MMDTSFNPTNIFLSLLSPNSNHMTCFNGLANTQSDSNGIEVSDLHALLTDSEVEPHNDFLFDEDDSNVEESDSSNNSNKEGQNLERDSDQTEGALHPISCTRCRKMHKFCTRTKPSCKRCTAKGVACEYREPRKQINKSRCSPSSLNTTSNKRKREELSVDNSNSIEPLSPYKKLPKESNFHSVVVNHTSMELLPWYFSNPLQLNFFICLRTKPTVGSNQIMNDKEEFDKYIQQYETCGVSESNKKERNAFFYSIQSLSYQSRGDQEQAQQSALKSRKYLSRSDDSLSLLNSYTYLNLALYEMGSGESQLCKFHLHCAKYFSQSVVKPTLSSQETKNVKTISFVENFSLQEMDVLQLSSSLPNLYEMVTGIQLHPQIANLLIQPIAQENSLDLVKTGTEVIKMLISNSRDKILNNSKEIRDEYLNGLQFTQDLLVEGLRLGVMVSITSRKDLIEESSLRITYLSQKEYFNNCSVFMIPFFIMAARVNLQVVKSIESGLRVNNQIGRGPNEGFIPIDYYNILKTNLRSLTSLNSRFKRISLVHNKLIDNIQNILQSSTNRD